MAQAPEQKSPESYQTFYLKNATGQDAQNDIQTTLRNMLPGARVYFAPTENVLSIRASAEDMAMAQKILADIDRPQKTYRVTYTIAESGGQSEAQHYALIVTPGAKSYSKQGTRVPIMTGAYKEGDAGSANTQFQYQDIGMNIETSLAGFEDGMRLHSKIEQTSISEEKSNVGIQDPVVKQSVLQVSSAFVPGKPLTIGSVDTPGGKHMQVQVTVELLQ
jgi:type II secretory pathway component GspD/PulD (secretin)